MKTAIGVGLMSGSSLDGIDLCCAEFHYTPTGSYQFHWIKTKTYPFPTALFDLLSDLTEAQRHRGSKTDSVFSHFALDCLQDFITSIEPGISIDFIASHGHTVKHDPSKGLSIQIGDGSYWAKALNIPVISNFRERDVKLGGQGAPLVPIGDHHLFNNYDGCLNLGGIANISFQEKGKRRAFDISMCNTPLNDIANRLGMPFDSNGDLARSGVLLPQLLSKLNARSYFTLPYPKSLDKYWYLSEIKPLLENQNYTNNDLLRTLTEHIAYNIAIAIHLIQDDDSGLGTKSILTTGGGAYNTFLIERIKNHLRPNYEIELGSKELIEFKEALIFAFMGFLRLRGEVNIWSSVTGATSDSCSGDIAWV